MSLTQTAGKVMTLSVYTILKGEHDEVSSMLKTLIGMSGKVETGQRALFEKLRKEVLAHAKAEQRTVYRELEGRLDDKDVVLEAEKEHQDVEELINEIQAMDFSSELMKPKLETLNEEISHHVDMEEHTMFDRMKDEFSDEEAKRIGKDYLDAKKEELQQLE